MIFCLVDNFSLLEYSSLDNKTARGADFRLRAGLWPVTLNLIRIMPAEGCCTMLWGPAPNRCCMIRPLGFPAGRSFDCTAKRSEILCQTQA